MTQEQKAKAYDRALEIAKAWCKLDNNDLCNDDLEKLFPELKESMDEKIRKALLDLFKIENFNGYVALNGIDVDDVIAWLEKQKTSEEAIKYLKENHSPSEISDFQAAMNIAVAKAYDRGRKDAERQGEKPKWGEEDDYNVHCCIAKAESDIAKNGYPGRNKELIDWLKSLKQRMEVKV